MLQVMDGGKLILSDITLRNREIPAGMLWFGPLNPCSQKVLDFARAEAVPDAETGALAAKVVEVEKVQIVLPPPDANGKVALPPVKEAVGIEAANLVSVTHAQFVAATAAPTLDPFALGFEIVNTNPEHEDVIYTERGLNALDLEVVPPDYPYPLFPVNALALHTYMQIGKGFSTWFKDRVEKFQLVEYEDYIVRTLNLPSKECGVEINGHGGHNTKEYWLAGSTALVMASDANSERGTQVIKFLSDRHNRPEELEKEQIVLPPPEPLPAFSEQEVAAGPCPKCGAGSGNDWSQCDGVCPMPMSPHYQPELAPCILTGAPGEDPEDCTTHDHETTPAAEAVVDAATGDLIPREIDGFVIHQRAEDGYVNATAMCKAAGRMIGHWSRNAETKKVLAELEGSIGNPIHPLVDTIVTGPNVGCGTWVHPTVALHLANWCSAKFYAAVLTWTISEWASGNKPTPAPVFNLPTTFAEALRLLADTSEVNEQLKLENTQLGNDLTAKEEQVEFLEKTVEAVKTSEERTVDMLMARMDVYVKPYLPRSSSSRRRLY